MLPSTTPGEGEAYRKHSGFGNQVLERFQCQSSSWTRSASFCFQAVVALRATSSRGRRDVRRHPRWRRPWRTAAPTTGGTAHGGGRGGWRLPWRMGRSSTAGRTATRDGRVVRRLPQGGTTAAESGGGRSAAVGPPAAGTPAAGGPATSPPPPPPPPLTTAAPTPPSLPAPRAAEESCAFGVEGRQWTRPQAMAPKGAASVPWRGNDGLPSPPTDDGDSERLLASGWGGVGRRRRRQKAQNLGPLKPPRTENRVPREGGWRRHCTSTAFVCSACSTEGRGATQKFSAAA